MSNPILEIKRITAGSVDPGENVIFDQESITSSGISYDADTGEITFAERGQYLCQWWVATGTTLRGSIEFGLKSSLPDELILGSSPIKTGQVSGFGTIDITTAGTTLSLVNARSESVAFSRTVGVKAHLLITQIGNAGPAEGIEVGLLDDSGNMIENDAPIIFDTVLTQVGSTILYNDTTGEFTISQNGYYLIIWGVTSDGSELYASVKFSLNVNGISHSTAGSPRIEGNVSGSSLITVSATPTTVTLTNVSGDGVWLQETNEPANLVIMAIPA